MYTPTTPIRINNPLGPLYIAVTGADVHSYHDRERGNVIKYRPCVRIGSNAEFTADPAAEDHWTVRGRSYAVHYEVFYEDRTAHTAAPYDRWHTRPRPYKGGFVTDLYEPVLYSAKTFDTMWNAVVTTLDAFDADHPGWRDLSRFLLHRGDASAATGRAEAARREAAEHDKVAAHHQALADTVGATLPDTITELIIKEA